MSKLAFLDTNIYLHYRWFEQVDWLRLLEARSVTIVIPPVTMRELNAKKDLPSRASVRRRAGKVLKRLLVLFESGEDAVVRERVLVKLEDRDPTIDFAAHQLVREVQDDHLIGTIIMYRRELPSADIVLVTSDAGLTLLAKARRHRIQTFRLPENLRLPEEPDPNQKRVMELENTIRRYEERRPKLSVAYANGDQHATFRLPDPLELSEGELHARVEDIRARYPKMAESGKTTVEAGNLADLCAALADMRPMDTVSPKDITAYNDELEDFYEAYSDYVARDVQFRNMQRRTVKVELVLTNDGTAPAEDIDVFMHFPDGFKLTTEDDYPSAPTPPDPPSRPKTRAEALGDFSAMMYFGPPSLEGYLPELVTEPANVSPPVITRGEGYDVRVHVERAKHGLQQPLEPLHVIFESVGSAFSFQIGYRILAADVPEPVEEQIHVIVEKG